MANKSSRLVVVLAGVIVALASLVAGPAWAVEPDEILADSALETRARQISAGLRCLVCQNQSIDDSNAPLARDLRLLVRERLKAGDSDDQVMRYVEDRYGEFVLLRPPINMSTLLLWLAPLIVLLAAIWMAARGVMRRSARPAPAIALSPAEEAKLRGILDAQPDHSDDGKRS
jgi:cytochrome c-type biogenesis protein CcmH